MKIRESHPPDDLRTLQRLVNRTWSPISRWHVGGLAWSRSQHVGAETGWRTWIWEEDKEVLAWGWLRLPGHLDPFVDPARPELIHEVLDRFESTAEGDELTVTMVGDEPLLEERGYRPRTAADPFFVHLIRDLLTLPNPHLPDGYSLRAIRGVAEVRERSAAHRAAFHPSTVTEDTYRTVMQSWPYRADLDRVVEAADGSIVAFCLAWLDAENRVGELEPVGTTPNHRRRGLGRAICLDACRRLRDAGADRAIVAARGDDAYPVPRSLYRSIGFDEVARNVTYALSRSGRETAGC